MLSVYRVTKVTISASTDGAGKISRVKKRQHRQEQLGQNISAIHKPATKRFIMSKPTTNIEVFNLLDNGPAKRAENNTPSQDQAQSGEGESRGDTSKYTASLLQHIYQTQTIRDDDAQNWSSIHNLHLRYWAYGSPPATVVAAVQAKNEKRAN